MAPPIKGEPDDGAYATAARDDPWLTLRTHFNSPEFCNQLFLGVDTTKRFLFSSPRTHCLVLGPPQSFKTAGPLISAVLNAPGPVVATSTKNDVYKATAIARSRVGRLWQYAPGGITPEEVLPGAIELRWSPIVASKDWGQAQILGKALADTLEWGAGHGENSGFFKQTSGQFIACVLHAAALADKPMEFVLEAINEGEALNECERTLRAIGGYSNIAADLLNAFRKLDGRTRGSIFITASTAFAAYRLPGAIESTRNPNFDVDKFVAGEFSVNQDLFSKDDWTVYNSPYGAPEILLPHGHFDTIYITSGSQAQGLVAPLVVGLLSRLREARYALNRDDTQNDRGRAPLFLALDEIANIAPIGELPAILSEGSSQGVLVMAVMQDLGQAKSRWPQSYETFLTLFREALIFPGIRNDETLDRLSMLSGEVWEETTSYGINTSYGTNRGRRADSHSESETTSRSRRVRFSKQEIAEGAEQGSRASDFDPRRMLVVQSSGRMGWGYATPYFYTPPIAEGLMACADHILDRTEPGGWQRNLPLPRMQPEMMVLPDRAVRWWADICKEWIGAHPR